MAGSEDFFCEVPALPAATCWKCKGQQKACVVCAGAGVIRRTSRRDSKPSRTGLLYPDYAPPGPLPPAQDDADLVPGAHEELCFLAGNWKLFQHKAQHRYSTDDVVCAWVAHRMRAAISAAMAGTSTTAAFAADLPARTAGAAEPVRPLRTVDIGCGIGSVLLMTAWLFPGATCLGVEAQPSRAAQAARSIRYNGVGSRVSVRLGDLRDPAVAEPAGYDLITGTPPYFDVATGATWVPMAVAKVTDGAKPDDEESARCLFEYKGGIEQYCEAAARLLAAPHGVFVVVETAQAMERSYAAAAAAGLRILARIDVIPRDGKPVLVNVFVMAGAGAPYITSSSDESSSAEDAAASRVRITPSTFWPDGMSPYAAAAGAASVAHGVPTPASGSATSTADCVSKEASKNDAGQHLSLAAAGSASGSAGAATGVKRRRQLQQGKATPDARAGEVVVRICVRGADGKRTPEYILLLGELGKPG